MVSEEKHLSVNDIRPSAFIEGQQKAIFNDVAMLLSRKEEFVAVPCSACGSAEVKNTFEKRGFHYVTCAVCDTMYMSPRPTPGVLEYFLAHSENYDYWDKHIFPASEKTRREKIFVPRVDRLLALCEKYGVKKSALLEVGAGHGTFCAELHTRHAFKQVVAVEPSPELAATCRKKNIETVESTIEKLDKMHSAAYDVVVNFEVIEHLFSPRDFLLKCRELLKAGGVIVITCPNGRGFDILTLGTVSDTVDHEHLNYFNPVSLGRLLSSCGFEVIEASTPGVLDAELVRSKFLDGSFDVSEQPFLKHILVDGWEQHGAAFQKFLQVQCLSSNMWLIAQKK